MTATDLRTLPALRQAVRTLAADHHVDTEVRARLALAATIVAEPAIAADRTVALTATTEQGADGQRSVLVVTLDRPDCAVDAPVAGELPLAAHSTSPRTVTWRIPLEGSNRADRADRTSRAERADRADRTGRAGKAPAGRAPRPRSARGGRTAPAQLPAQLTDEGETGLLLKELGAALAQIDALKAEHRLLKHELSETNNGVLALYVQLDERDQELRRAHGRVLRELEDALRPPVLDVPGVELGVHYAPADTEAPTGGDLYDWFVLPDGTVHITVVDALGHGVRSTRSALTVTHAVRTLALEGHALESIVARANEALTPFDPDIMATVLLARVDPATGDVHLANGSHPPALLVRRDGDAAFLDTPGRGIGFPLPGSERVRRTRLAPGDLLLLYTDGLTESRRDPLEGESRLTAAARRHARLPAPRLTGEIAKEMHAVILHADDTLALAVRLTGPGDAPNA
ncbi:SpoIIE family protein phosphatase [Streptomyces sp. p1417]|uniref:SpoIIE family protein phosphatase n=1 Tax=Streptomyces typhae TaxID=2681492 RepID=A0A6L6WVW0_9ACTN|nr:PP2C family protein-serine/threonine phosphatase [Streptomyces typhae]MVO85628.1 SpoIIE family protein phosphatase [Streptomyces typhae]